jgi:hypothetical protein
MTVTVQHPYRETASHTTSLWIPTRVSCRGPQEIPPARRPVTHVVLEGGAGPQPVQLLYHGIPGSRPPGSLYYTPGLEPGFITTISIQGPILPASRTLYPPPFQSGVTLWIVFPGGDTGAAAMVMNSDLHGRRGYQYKYL